MQRILTTLTFLLFCAISEQSSAQLIPDSSYSQDGYFIKSSTTDGEYGSRIFELSDGSTLLAGSKNGKLRVRKHDAQGNVLTTFGTLGEASIPSLDLQSGSVNYIYDMEVTPNGKIFILAELEEMNLTVFDSSKSRILIACFEANGAVANSFNNSGYLLDRPSLDFYYNPKSMCINTKNEHYEIFVGSWAYENGHASCPMGFGRWCVSKYKEDGSVDATFYNNTGYMQEGSDIIKQGPTQTPIAIPYDIKMMSDGNVLVCGSMHYFDNAFFSFSISTSGQWNTNYGINGRCIHPVTFEVPTNDLTNAQILKDESCAFYSILRYFGSTDSSVLKVVKNNPNGTVNNSFGTSGKLLTTYLSQQYPILLFKTDGSFLLSYYRPYGANFSNQKIEFKNYFSNGIQDMTFGIGGICKTQPRNPDTYINRSTVLHGIWNKTETGFFLATNNQIPNTNSGYGIFKYKWPGLIPLQTNSVEEIATELTLYPNPVIGEQTFYVEGKQTIQDVQLYDAKGLKIAVQNRFINENKISIQPLNQLPAGIYFVLCEGKTNRTMQSLLVK